MAFRYSDLLVDVWATDGCPNPSKAQCPSPSKPQCPPPSQDEPTSSCAVVQDGLSILQEQLRASV